MTDQEYDAMPVGTRFWLAEYGRLDNGTLLEVRIRVAEKMADGRRWLSSAGVEMAERRARIAWPSKSRLEFEPDPSRCFLSADQARLYLHEVIEAIHRRLLRCLESTAARSERYTGRIGPKTTTEETDEPGVPSAAT